MPTKKSMSESKEQIDEQLLKKKSLIPRAVQTFSSMAASAIGLRDARKLVHENETKTAFLNVSITSPGESSNLSMSTMVSPAGAYSHSTVYFDSPPPIIYDASPVSGIFEQYTSPSKTISLEFQEVSYASIKPHELHPLQLPEILLHIFSFLETPLNTGTDPTKPIDFVKVDSIKYTISKPKLHSCALVNKLWNACATKLLWKNIKIGSEVSARNLHMNLMGDLGGMMPLSQAKKYISSTPPTCCSMDTTCDFHLSNTYVPSPINGWVYGQLIKSFTLIPPHAPIGESNFESWNVDQVITSLALCCPGLEELNLSNCIQVTDKSMVIVAQHCRKLQKLNLNRCDQISTVSILELAKYCKNLVILNLSRPLLTQKTIITDDALFQIVDNLQNVMELRLRNCDQTTDRTIIRAAETSNLKLRALDLSRLTDNAICQGVAKYCHSLQSLALNGCKKLTDRSITALLTFCPNIASLSLAHLPFITNEVLQSMAPQLKKLSILSLNGCSNVADSSIRAISEHCTSLQSLSLFSLKITDEAVQCVAERCKDLVSLSISGCVKVTDKGAVKIMHLLKLQSLYLNGAKITDRSILLIALNCSSIRALSLNDCEMLTDKAIVGLSRFCTQIQSLSMNNCGVTAVGVKSLIDRLPDLRELSIKQCHLCILDGPGSDVECKATGGINATAIGSSVLEQINRRRIALMR